MSPNNTLAKLVGTFAQTDGNHNTLISALMLYRRSVTSEPMPCLYGLGLGITTQGGKRVMLGDEIFDYGSGQSIITTVDLPVVSHVTQASASEPYLGMWLSLDTNLITQLAAEMEFPTPLKPSNARALSVMALDEGLLDALIRLIRLLNEPILIPQLAPLLQQEITVRLLSGQHGSALRHLVALGSPNQQIAKVLSWLKLHFTNDVTMDELAAKAHMSPSTFRQHFRAVAGMSPLQYVKYLRLQEARQLMLNDRLDTTSAAMRVGYESASQFSREYSRLFGQPPQRDIRRMKA